MENPVALKLINKIQVDLLKNGFDAKLIVADLKRLREYALEEQNPVLVKAIRLTYEHIEANRAFLVPIPDDEPLEEGFTETQKTATSTGNNLESLEYLISLFVDLKNKNNIADLREYNKALLEF